MTANPTVCAAWVKGILDLFESVGLDVCDLLRGADINADDIRNRNARFSHDQISALWELAVARSGDPYLGLALPDRVHPGSFDVMAHIMMACPNLLVALDQFLHYLRIVSDVVQIKLVSEEDRYGLTISLAEAGRPVPRARIEFAVLTILNNLRWLTGLSLRPMSVDFPYPPPDNIEPYELAFHCPLRFNAQIHQIYFSRSDLAAALPTANSALVALNDRLAREQLTRLDATNIAVRAKQFIAQHLSKGDPLRAYVARDLCLSERTLQRRLQEEGTSFNELVDAIRRELAGEYLQMSQVPLSQIAYLLGFAAQSTFFRACRRWFGTSPGDHRAASPV